MAEADRRPEDSRYASIIETTTDGFWLVGLDGRIVEANRAAADMLGYTREQMAGLHLAEVEAVEDRDAVLAHVAKIVAQGRDRFESQLRRRDGTILDVEVSASVLPDGGPYSVAFVRDITERKRTEALLAARVRLSEYAFGHTLHEFLQLTIDEAEHLTGSSVGFLHFVDGDQQALALQRWSTNTLQNMCTAKGAGTHYPVAEAGVWADAVRQRRIIIHNDYAALADRRGLPDGHAPVVRELVVPVFRQDRVVAVLGVGNKESDYTQADAQLVNRLADIAWDIAGALLVQQELGESEQRYRSLFEHLLDPVCMVDRETLRVIEANLAARGRYAAAVDPGAPGGFAALHDPDEADAVKALLRGEPGAAARDVWTHRDRDGKAFPVRLRTSALTLRGRSGIVVIARDVSDELAAAAEQTRREAYLRTLIASISDVITIVDRDLTIVYKSPNVSDLFGYDPGEMVGTPVLDNVHPDDRDKVASMLRRVAAVAGAEDSLVYRLRRREGGWRYVEGVMRNLLDDPHVAGLLVNFRDVTERKQAEDRFRLAFQTSPDAISITTVDRGVYVDVNRGFLEISGYAREELVGHSSLDINIWPDESERAKLVGPLRTEGAAHNVEITYERKDGERRAGLISASYIELEGVPHILSITRDITDLRQAEAARLELEQRLLHSQKLESVGRLAGGIAHDFNNLLTVITGNAELAALELGDDHPVRKEIELISSTAERAAGLTGQLLAYSREQITQPRRLALPDLVAADARLVQRMIGEEVELVIDCPPATGQVEADPVQLQQILFNLAVNARDAMPEGGVLTIATSEVRDVDLVCTGCRERFRGDYAELTVGDTGGGIAPEHMERIFDPFFTTKEVGKGTGMGLATTMGLLAKVGGHVVTESSPGKGTVFRVFLPLHRETVAPAAEVGESGGREGAGEHVLVVEDDPSVRSTIVGILQRHGYRVTVADDPVVALSLLDGGVMPPDLVLSDVVMPGMNGEQLLQTVLTRGHEFPFLFMSGYPADLLQGRRLLAPDRPYLRKPFRPDELLQLVRHCLDVPRPGGRPAART